MNNYDLEHHPNKTMAFYLPRPVKTDPFIALHLGTSIASSETHGIKWFTHLNRDKTESNLSLPGIQEGAT